MQQFGKSFSARRSQGEMTNKHGDLLDADRPQEVQSVRAKQQRHGKMTADKWNQ